MKRHKNEKPQFAHLSQKRQLVIAVVLLASFFFLPGIILLSSAASLYSSPEKINDQFNVDLSSQTLSQKTLEFQSGETIDFSFTGFPDSVSEQVKYTIDDPNSTRIYQSSALQSASFRFQTNLTGFYQFYFYNESIQYMHLEVTINRDISSNRERDILNNVYPAIFLIATGIIIGLIGYYKFIGQPKRDSST